MRSLLFQLISVLLIVNMMGCSSDEGNNSGSVKDATGLAEDTGKGQHEYMAVCSSTDAHGGNEYVLTKWVSSRQKATIYGQEHEQKNRGHIVVYKQRAKL